MSSREPEGRNNPPALCSLLFACDFIKLEDMKAEAWSYGTVLCERVNGNIDMKCIEWNSDVPHIPCGWSFVARNVIEARMKTHLHLRKHS